jgi:uncharacterized protein (DUF2235 family)
MRWLDRLLRRVLTEPTPAPPTTMVPRPKAVRGRVDHVIILDGTMSSLRPGEETNAGLTWKLLAEGGPRAQLSLFYEPGLQWTQWRSFPDVAQGRGLSRQIRRAYGHLASHYRPGDRIWLFGFSRGAFAVRSLAGVVDRIGLLRQDEATERAVTQAWRHYRQNPDSDPARAFRRRFCHEAAPIEAICVWDTVKALGLRLPLLWLLAEKRTAFHDTRLGPSIRHGFHALARDETRAVYAPILWTTAEGWMGNVEQVWFRGAHGDVGGQVAPHLAARPLSNIPLVWMLDRAESAGLPLPPGWRDRFPCDVAAPMTGTWSGWGAVFLLRRRRRIGRDKSERLHETIAPAPLASAPMHPGLS